MFKVTSFYKFFPIEKQRLAGFKKEIAGKALDLNILGLALLGEEGLNGSFCGAEKSIEEFKKYISGLFSQDFFWKDSCCRRPAFKRLSIKIKKDIINIGRECKAPSGANRLSPKEWDERLAGKKAQVLDVRNSYEVKVGKFKGAKDLNIENFQEFPERLKTAGLDKNKETLIYCTGGIRCEKAEEIMKAQGFKNVFQLEGGLLHYLQERPNSQFEKECFVFDHRAALDQKLQPSKKLSLCPHCGQPGGLSINCRQCEKPARICSLCKEKALFYETCSKNCAYHFKAGHACRKKYKRAAL